MEAPEDENYELLPAHEAVTDKNMSGDQETLLKPEGRWGDDLANYAILSSTAITLVVSWYATFCRAKKFTWFFLHPTLETVALLLFTYGITTLQPTSKRKTKESGLWRHQAFIMFLALPTLIVGTLAEVYKRKGRFKTFHGILGIIITVFFVIQVLFGGATVWYNGAAFGGGVKAKKLWKYHRLSGYILFVLLVLTNNLGGWTNWGANRLSLLVRLVAYVLAPVVTIFAVCFRIRLSKMKFF